MVSQAVENQLRTLFRRCVQCPNTTPSCPACPSGQICSQLLQTCTQCASTICVPNSESANESPGPSSSNGGGGGPNVGAIAGGVVGGVVFIALLTFLVWKFIIKPRRDQYDDNWQEEEYEQEPKPGEENDAANNFTMQRDARASTHTVGSIASTVFTRASNVIQIAYIPGITNRGLESPGVLVPPVPPIPAMGSPAHSPYASQRADTESESHYFMPSDLRGSTYSADSDSRSAHHQRQSITPSLARTSMASTVYRNNAIISPVPAQSAVRGKAAVVSVKSGSSSGDNTPAITSPPVPSLDYARIGKPLQVQIPSSADKAGPSPQDSLKSTGTATYGKPIALNLTKMKSKQKSGNSTPDVSSISDADTIKAGPSGNQQLGHIINAAALKDNASTSSRPHSRAQQVAAQPSTFDDTTDDDDEDEHARSRRSLIGGNRLRTSEVTEIADTPALTHSSNTASPDSPFADQTSSLLPTVAERDERRRSTLSGINAVIEEATRRASRQPTHMGLGSDKRNESPFDDANATDDN